MRYPDFNDIEAATASGEFGFYPLSCEILSDIRTPMEVLRVLQGISKHCFLLESVEPDENWGRYTFLGYDPKLEITCKDGEILADGEPVETADPNSYIREILAAHRSPKVEGLPTFTGGLVGYFAYDYIKYAEPTLDLGTDDPDAFNDIDLMLFDKVIVFDNIAQRIILIANMELAEGRAGYEHAVGQLEDMRALICTGTMADNPGAHLHGDFTALFDKESYCAMVEEGKRHIFEGDIFQVVLSNRLQAPFSGSLLDVYRVLRTVNPSPYMFYIGGTDVEIAGASPETLVKLEDGVLHTFPLAGTRPRGADAEEDERLENELLVDPKELAEHNMLVDLGRNDLGKISGIGSVEVEEYQTIHRFSRVMHIGSTVRGRLAPDRDALDAVSAVLPAGTLSGAPKIRACEIINELEHSKRGIYGGAIGYIDLTGNMDTCIAIRIAYRKGDTVYVRSGAGIVADSDPATEYQECLNKAAAVVTSIEEATRLSEDCVVEPADAADGGEAGA
ncbi:MAG: chorismate-binding protein [Coriobacteriaceae bacterium]|nr:chorismate-binding protein [Coriobacteriaceae bacterium]